MHPMMAQLGHRHARTRRTDETHLPTVVGKRTAPMYRPGFRAQFFMDGSLAHASRDPQIVCDTFSLQLKHRHGHVSWVRVSRDAYWRAVIGAPFAG